MILYAHVFFIKKSKSNCIIVVVYVDDLSIIGTHVEIPNIINYLKKEYKMKDFGKTKFYLGMQIKHLIDKILIHQSTYTENVLKRIYMDKTHPLSI